MLTFNNKYGGFRFLVLPFLSLFLFWGATPAWAVQSHGGAEGLVSHQVGHVLFFVGMVILLARQYHKKLVGPGWREFKVFLFLIIAWNCLTFIGHWMRETVDMDKFIKANTHIEGFQATTAYDFLFYITRLDHILLVPAFFFLLMAVKRWDQAS